MTPSEISSLQSAMQRRLAALPQRLRPYTTEYQTLSNSLLLTGSRGCGKSTFLLHHVGNKRIMYLSADNPKIITKPLYDVVSDIFMLGYEGVIIDEVHFAANWSLHLKALYDDFPNKILWISDSSSLVIRAGIGDLSRRYVPIRMPLMSFREFLFLETGINYSIYHLKDSQLPVQPDASLLNHFTNYRTFGMRPFYQNGDFEARYMSVIDKVLNTDVPFFLPHVTDNNLRLMRAIIGTLSTSAIPRLQVSSLCSDWGIGAEKLYHLLNVMESVGLLRIVRLQNDHKSQSVGAKIFFADPCAYAVLQADIGTEREAFIAHCFSQAGYTIEAMRDEMKGDFIVSKGNNQFIIEVGGKHKKPKKSDFVARDNTDYPTDNGIPFWLLGMMW